MADKKSLFTKDFILITLMMFCSSLNYFAILINITQYAIETLDASTFQAGISAGLYVIGGLVSRLLLGKYIEYFGRRRMAIIFLFLALLMSVTYLFINSLEMLMVVRLLHGMTYGVTSSCASDIMARILPPERRGEGLGYYFLSVTFATALGPYIGLALASDYVMLFSIGIVLYFIAFVLSLFVNVPEETLTPEQIKEARSFSLSNMLAFVAVPLSVVCMIFFMGYSGILAFITEYSAEIDMVSIASYYYIMVASGTFLSRLTTGKIYDSNGPNKIISLGYIVFIAGMLIFSQTVYELLFMVSGFMMGYGMSIVFAVCQASIISMSSPHKYGVTTSTFSAITDLGSGCGPMILGALVPFLGYRFMFVLCAGFAAISFVLYWVLHGWKVIGKRPLSA